MQIAMPRQQFTIAFSPVLKGYMNEAHDTDTRHQTFTLRDGEGCLFCFACGWEALLGGALSIHKKAIATEMLRLLRALDEASFPPIRELATSGLVCLIQTLGGVDEALARVLLEIAPVFQIYVTDYFSCIESIRIQLLTLTWKQAFFVLVLMGRMLHNTTLAQELSNSFQPLIEHIIGAMSYPDEEVRSSAAFVLTQCVAVQGTKAGLIDTCGVRLVSSTIELLTKAQSEGAQNNALALLHSLVASECIAMVRSHVTEGNLVAALKPRLLSPQAPQRALAMMIIENLCKDSADITGLFIEEGLLDFIIEASVNSQWLVVQAAIDVLILFSNHPFFASHLQFGYGALVEIAQTALEHCPAKGFALLLRVVASSTNWLKDNKLETISHCLIRGIEYDDEAAAFACLISAELLDYCKHETRDRMLTITQHCWELAVGKLSLSLQTSFNQNLLHAVLHVFTKCLREYECDELKDEFFTTFLNQLLGLLLERWHQLSSPVSAVSLDAILLTMQSRSCEMRSTFGTRTYTVVLTLRSRHRAEPNLSSLGDQLLSALLLEDIRWCSAELRTTVGELISGIPDKPEDLLGVLTEQGIASLELKVTVICLLYSALLNGDKLVDFVALERVLQQFLTHHSDLSQYPSELLHLLTFLVATVQPIGSTSEVARILTRAILSGVYPIAGRVPVTVIRWLWQHPDLRSYSAKQMATWLSESSNAFQYSLEEWSEVILHDSNGPALLMETLTTHHQASRQALRLIEVCLAKSPDVASTFTSLGLITSLQRMLTLAANWDPATLHSAASCAVYCLKQDVYSDPFIPALHVTALLAREFYKHPPSDKLLLLILNAANLILCHSSSTNSQEVLSSIVQSEKLLSLLSSSLRRECTNFEGMRVLAAAYACWTLLISGLCQSAITQSTLSSSIQQLTKAAPIETLSNLLNSQTVLLRMVGSHALSTFLSSYASTEQLAYHQLREWIVVVQGNIVVAQDEAFKLASIDCLSSLMDVEAVMIQGQGLSDFPWNRFLAENIIDVLPDGSPSLSDLQFLALMVKHRSCWLKEIFDRSSTEALLLKFACASDLLHVLSYAELISRLHKEGLIADLDLLQVAIRAVQRQQNDIRILSSSSSSSISPHRSKWRDVEGVILPQHVIWPERLTNVTADDVSRQLAVLSSVLSKTS